jgi:hypothetical protein
MFHHRVPQGHLTISGHGDFPFMPDDDHRRPDHLFHFHFFPP